MGDLIDRLTLWAVQGGGTPGSVPTRYACEVEIGENPEAAEVRCAIRNAFIDGMEFGGALAEEGARKRSLVI
jgi:hypothetical protein